MHYLTFHLRTYHIAPALLLVVYRLLPTLMMKMYLNSLLIATTLGTFTQTSAFSAFSKPRSQTTALYSTEVEESTDGNVRRDLLLGTLSTIVLGSIPRTASAAPTVTGTNDGNLPDLPPDAGRSYLQYRGPLQVATDYYVFELQSKLDDVDDWGEINVLFQTNNNRGQGQPNKIERDYTNVMRILALSMPPEEADAMRAAQFKFEKAMFNLSKATAGVRRDLPVDVDTTLITKAKSSWEDGRVALNEFLSILNTTTGLNEMRLIPAAGPDQTKQYGRSKRKYLELAKQTKLCQNRGGPALSQAWGQLMVSGYLQDSCGIPDLVDYFYQ